MGVIYLRTNTVNGMKYIGQTNNIAQRNRQFNSLKCISNEILNNDRLKYGVDSFETTILGEYDTQEEGDLLERFYIRELNTIYPNGYNLDSGGRTGYRHSKETIEKIVEANKLVDRNYSHLIDCGFQKGHIPWNKGKNDCFSKETLAKMSDKRKGMKLSDKTRDKMSESRKGIFVNREDQSKPVYQYKDNKLIAIYHSRNEAGRAIGVRGTSIGNCCNGGYYTKGKWVNCNTVKGYKFSYEPL